MKRSLMLFSFAAVVRFSAQGNHEIQVCPGETQAAGTAMIELHNNFTAEGSQGFVNGVYGDHQLHETVEIAQGFTDWFETGLYIFRGANPDRQYTL